MLARYDRLTGLPDRSFLEERLATLYSSAKRHTDQFAVLLVDINQFEEILGHSRPSDQAIRFSRPSPRS